MVATDCAGNAAQPWALDFDVDLDGPRVELDAVAAPAGRMSARLVAADDVTNVESLHCRIDGGAWAECPIAGVPTPVRTLRLETTVTVPVGSGGSHVLDVYALDRWGHASRTASLSVP